MTSRRTFIGQLAAAPLIGGVAIIASDPVFAAIEEHEIAERHYAECTRLTDQVLAKQQGRKITKRDRQAFRSASEKTDRAKKSFSARSQKRVPALESSYSMPVRWAIVRRLRLPWLLFLQSSLL